MGLIIYVAFDVHKHHKQSGVLISEVIITIFMILDMTLSVMVQRNDGNNKLSFCSIFDITMVFFYLILMFYLFTIEFDVNEDIFGMTLLIGRYIIQILRMVSQIVRAQHKIKTQDAVQEIEIIEGSNYMNKDGTGSFDSPTDHVRMRDTSENKTDSPSNDRLDSDEIDADKVMI